MRKMRYTVEYVEAHQPGHFRQITTLRYAEDVYYPDFVVDLAAKENLETGFRIVHIIFDGYED